jgi:hypothetical protein
MSSDSCVLCVSRTNFQAGGARSRSCAVAVRMHDYCCPGDIVYRGSHTKKLYTLEGKPPSVFVRPVVGEALSTLPDCVQKSRRE